MHSRADGMVGEPSTLRRLHSEIPHERDLDSPSVTPYIYNLGGQLHNPKSWTSSCTAVDECIMGGNGGNGGNAGGDGLSGAGPEGSFVPCGVNLSEPLS